MISAFMFVRVFIVLGSCLNFEKFLDGCLMGMIGRFCTIETPELNTKSYGIKSACLYLGGVSFTVIPSKR